MSRSAPAERRRTGARLRIPAGIADETAAAEERIKADFAAWRRANGR